MASKPMRGVVVVAGLAAAMAVAWWLQRDSDRPSGAPAPVAAPGARPPANGPGGGLPSVEVAQVQTLRLVDDAESVGSLRSRQSVVLRPEVSGRVVRIAFEDGAAVRQGQLLVQLDDTLQRAELSQAQAQLSIARANLQRNEELVAQNFVAQRVLDESRASLQVAQAQVQLAEARVARMRLVAPFDGTVGIRSVNLGDYVKDGADLVNLEDTSQLVVDFRLPERYQARVAPGQPVQVRLDALPGQTFTARVQALDPLVDANGRALQVRASLPADRRGGLRPGLFARVTVTLSVDEAALMVPEEAIVPQGGRQTVVRLEPSPDGAQAPPVSRRTEVTLGLRRGALVQVLDGLQAGDTVVVAGQQRLQRDGTAVRVVDLARAGAGPTGSVPGAGTAPPAAPKPPAG
ncbi:efflux RND transporter periplasmic adaptor subunit [Aquabacterium sp. A08]|uniref:efflux RND transporter periplasmic adaptor subunit n=1 Tax=Aquabacterium sp. A08 TaxID=2718532 RepID=UPI00142118B6|nr:efflux RND transporter periplasmic adaptor subunit [Aquabacterium sp. A08]NIC43155.1 efflux RND transporter periplasmic adaptor subunit [Aquabacterium sp. A08]